LPGTPRYIFDLYFIRNDFFHLQNPNTMKASFLAFPIASFFLIFMSSCSQNTLKDMKNSTPANPVFKTFSYADAVPDTAMIFIEEVVNHDEGNAAHSFTDMILDSTSYTFTITAVSVNGVAGITAADQERIKDSVLAHTRDYPSRIDTTILNDHDLVFIDISAWQLNGTTLSFWGTIGIGDMDPAFSGADCSDPKPYTSNDYWMFDFFGTGGGCKSNPANSSSASLEMEKRLNYMKSAQCNINPCLDNQAYYSPIIRVYEINPWYHPSNPDPTGAEDGYMDYLLFFTNNQLRDCNSPNPEDCFCLSPTEMQFHTEGAIIISNKSTVSPGNGFIPFFYNLTPELIPGQSTPYFHQLDIAYGKIKCR